MDEACLFRTIEHIVGLLAGDLPGKTPLHQEAPGTIKDEAHLRRFIASFHAVLYTVFSS
jgi:hypothetical protein